VLLPLAVFFSLFFTLSLFIFILCLSL
jgi:hypothetical protein